MKLSEQHIVVKSFRRLTKEDDILMQHNLLPYYKVAKSFNEGNKRVAVVHATGTGKAFLAIRWLTNELNGGISYSQSLRNPPISIEANPDARILYLAPTHAIINQVKEHLNSVGKNKLLQHIEFITYAKLLSMLKRSNHEFTEEELKTINLTMLEQTRFNEFIKQFTHIVVDEFHHVDENKWGSAVQIALNNSDAKILGLTATPVRSTGTDVAQTVFNGNVVSTISLADAIENGILPVPDYYTAVYSYEKMLTSLEAKIAKIKDERKRVAYTQMVEEIKTEIVRSGGVKEGILKHLKKHPNGKFIIFSDDIAMSYKNMEAILDYLSELNIARAYDINSGNPNAHEELLSFRRAKGKGLKIAFAVDMISEGVHVDDLDGIIMLRSTNSFIVYLQQLGRALASGKDKHHPLVLDLVNNIGSAFEYQQQSEDIVNFFRTIATRKTDDPTIKKLVLRLQKEDKILQKIRELDKMISPNIVSTEEKLRILALLVKSGVDLNNIKYRAKLSDYMPVEEAGVLEDYKIGIWVNTARQGIGGKDLINGLIKLGLKVEGKKKYVVPTEEKLRILRLLVSKGVKLKDIHNHDKLTKFMSLEEAGVIVNYQIGSWLANAKAGQGSKDFIESLKEFDVLDYKKRMHFNAKEKLRIFKLLVEHGVNLNDIKIEDKLSKYISLEEASAETDYKIGKWIKSIKDGHGEEELKEGLRILGFENRKNMIVSLTEKFRILKMLVERGVDLNKILQYDKVSKYISLEEAGVEEDYTIGTLLASVRRGHGSEQTKQTLQELGLISNIRKHERVTVKEKLRLFKLLADKGIDLNNIHVSDKLSDFISLEEAGVTVDYKIGQWLDTAKQGKVSTKVQEGLKDMGYKGIKTKEFISAQEKLRIFKLLVEKGVDINSILTIDHLSKYISLEEAGVETDYRIGKWLKVIDYDYKLGQGNQEFIAGLTALGYRFGKNDGVDVN